jgi:hypothetical protein
MGNFDAHKWFKKQYLEEGMSPEEYAKAKEAERLESHPEKDKIKAIQAMMAKERPLKENMSPAEAVVELNFLMDELQNISGEVKQIMQQTFPDEYRRGDAYGAFDFGTSGNRFDTTFEGILDDLASMGDEME